MADRAALSVRGPYYLLMAEGGTLIIDNELWLLRS